MIPSIWLFIRYYTANNIESSALMLNVNKSDINNSKANSIRDKSITETNNTQSYTYLFERLFSHINQSISINNEAPLNLKESLLWSPLINFFNDYSYEYIIFKGYWLNYNLSKYSFIHFVLV